MGRKKFKDLTEREILALGHCFEEEDGPFTGSFAEGCVILSRHRTEFDEMREEGSSASRPADGHVSGALWGTASHYSPAKT